MQKIMDCRNLLGDSIYLLKPMRQFMERYPEEVLGLICSRGLAFDLFRGCFDCPLFTSPEDAKLEYPDAPIFNLGAGRAADLAFDFSRAPGGRQLHISEAYCRLLGFELEGSVKPLTDWCSIENDLPAEHVLISPFSASCSYHTDGVRNKTIDDWKWEHIIRFLRNHIPLPVKIIGAPNEKLTCSVPMNNYITANSISELETAIRASALYVGIDNGVGHVAATLGVPMVSLWSKAASVEFIAPLYGRRTTFLNFDAKQISPVSLFVGLRRFTQMLIEGQYDKEGTPLSRYQTKA